VRLEGRSGAGMAEYRASAPGEETNDAESARPTAVASRDDSEVADAPLLPPTAVGSSSSTDAQKSPDKPIILKTVSHLTKRLPEELKQKSRDVVERIKPLLGSAAVRLHEAVKETATKEGRSRIASSTWAAFSSDMGVAAHASHDMVVLWLCPGPFKNLDIDAQYRHWSVRWNPLYWVMFVPLVPCIILGKWLHSLWGQGDMMRADETIEESRVRLHWVYCLDGPIAGAALLDLVDVLIDVPMYEQRKFKDSLLSWCMTLTVTAAYVLANAYFLDVMRRRSLVGVRLVIVYQTVFAVGLLNMLVAGAIHNSTTRRNGEYIFESWLAFFSWSTRLVMTAFMLGAAFVYSRLWNIYRDEVVLAVHSVSFHEHGAYLRKECLQYMILPVAAILMWVLLLLAATLDDDMFWDALV